MSKVGELITPTGRLVMSAEDMRVDRSAWLAARRQGPGVKRAYRIGASEVPSILDLEGVDTPAHVYRRKVYGIDTPTNEAMMWGSLLEDPIAVEWCRRNRAVIDEIGLVARAGDDWALATIDRRVRECPVYKDTPHGECLLEVKNAGFQTASRWRDDLPDRILAQMLFQLWVTGYGHGHYAVLVGGNTMKQGIIYADREAELTDYIIKEVRKFRTEHLLAEVEPSWDGTSKAAKMIELDKATHPERVGELDINGVDAVHEYAKAAAAESVAAKQKERAKAKLAQLADGALVVKFADHYAYGYRPTRRTSANLDRLAEKYPDAYADPEIVRETNGYAINIGKDFKVPTAREVSK